MKKVINTVQNNWSKDLIVRFLYVKLAPYFQRDLLYFLSSDEEKERQFKQGFINRFPHVVCSTLADFYVDLFEQFGIHSKKIVSNSAKIPLFAILVEGDYGWYFLDPLNDLFSNQYGLKPYFFGIIPRYNTIRTMHPELVELPREYIKELDDTLNFKYHDEYFSILHQKLSQRKTAKEFFGFQSDQFIDLKDKKLQFYSDELINLGNVQGPFERAQLYNYLNDKILNRGEKRYVCVKIKDWDTNPHISIELKNQNKIIIYEEEKIENNYRLIKKL